MIAIFSRHALQKFTWIGISSKRMEKHGRSIRCADFDTYYQEVVAKIEMIQKASPEEIQKMWELRNLD